MRLAMRSWHQSVRIGVAAAALLAGLGLALAADDADTGRINHEGAAAQGPGAGANVAPVNPAGGTAHNPAPAMPGQPAPPASPTAAVAIPAAPEGPIGATGQTMPAKFSTENAAKDNIPLAVRKVAIEPAQKQALFDSIEHERPPAATTGVGSRWIPPQIQAGAVLPEGIDAHEMPAEVADGIPALSGYQYVAVQDHVWIVEPLRRVVIDGLTR